MINHNSRPSEKSTSTAGRNRLLQKRNLNLKRKKSPLRRRNLNRNPLLRNNRTNRRLLRRRNHRNNRTRLLPRRNNLRMCSLWELPC
jgi:hypothetical protein